MCHQMTLTYDEPWKIVEIVANFGILLHYDRASKKGLKLKKKPGKSNINGTKFKYYHRLGQRKGLAKLFYYLRKKPNVTFYCNDS